MEHIKDREVLKFARQIRNIVSYYHKIGKVKNGAEPEHPKYETYAARPLAA